MSLFLVGYTLSLSLILTQFIFLISSLSPTRSHIFAISQFHSFTLPYYLLSHAQFLSLSLSHFLYLSHTSPCLSLTLTLLLSPSYILSQCHFYILTSVLYLSHTRSLSLSLSLSVNLTLTISPLPFHSITLTLVSSL